MSGRVGGEMGPNRSMDDDWCVNWYILRREFTAEKKIKHTIKMINVNIRIVRGFTFEIAHNNNIL